jgi:hypothetical protein
VSQSSESSNDEDDDDDAFSRFFFFLSLKEREREREFSKTLAGGVREEKKCTKTTLFLSLKSMKNSAMLTLKR